MLKRIVRTLPVLVLVGCATASHAPISPTQEVEAVASAAEPLRGAPDDYNALMDVIGDSRFVLLGESTHGTREFYRERARITQRLITEKGFTLVVVEADWQDAYDVNAFIHGRGAATSTDALRTFERFPQWMWANSEIRDLVEWMRSHNASAAGRERPIGFYGMDVYGVQDAIAEVIRFLQEHDPGAASRAQDRYKCLQRYASRMEEYGRDIAMRRTRSCLDEAHLQFQELSDRVAREDGDRPGGERLMSAWQSARVVVSGEQYYRAAFGGSVASWNIRDRHMADTLDALSAHLGDHGPEPAKVIVWAHNSHLGDARQTARADIGELNVGQLMRQRHNGSAVIVAFTTYEGTVRAANDWGGRDDARRLRPALPESYAATFHATNIPAFLLRLRGNTALGHALPGPRPQRFVGVIYAPATERQSHYFDTDLVKQYDVVVHIDQTTALDSLGK